MARLPGDNTTDGGERNNQHRRNILRKGGAALAAVSVGLGSIGTGTASDRDWQDSGNNSCGERDWQCQAQAGYEFSETVNRDTCGFTNRVVFPILTAVSMDDGVPVSTKVVMAGWATSSSACYALDKLEEIYGFEVRSATMRIQNNDEHSLLQP